MKIFPQNRAARILTVIILAAVLFLVFDAAFKFYKQRRGEKRVEELANELKRIEQEIFDKKAVDKIGGKTPQETLNLFIAAVEKGDYELASRYFVVEKQEKWRKDLEGIAVAGKINKFLGPLRQTENSTGAYLGEEHFFVDEPVSVKYLRYPSGNWKIEEI